MPLHGRIACLQGELSEAEKLVKRTQEIFEKSLGQDHPNIATILCNRAVLLIDQVRATRKLRRGWKEQVKTVATFGYGCCLLMLQSSTTGAVSLEQHVGAAICICVTGQNVPRSTSVLLEWIFFPGAARSTSRRSKETYLSRLYFYPSVKSCCD